MEQNTLPVAVFDSGLGGISVLRQMVRLLPEENFLYYGDSLHAPYGVRSQEEIRDLCDSLVRELLDRGMKALVIACNTATSAAAKYLRLKYPELLILGIEPAIKPAAERHPGGRVLVMATPATLAQGKFHRLLDRLEDGADFVPVACGGLMEFVEQGKLRGPEVEAFLAEKLGPYLTQPADAIVLGCTHYPFLVGAIRRVVGPGPEILDGSLGVAAQLRRRLEEAGLRNPGPGPGRVEFDNSLREPEILALMRALFDDREEDIL